MARAAASRPRASPRRERNSASTRPRGSAQCTHTGTIAARGVVGGPACGAYSLPGSRGVKRLCVEVERLSRRLLGAGGRKLFQAAAVGVIVLAPPPAVWAYAHHT